jgi:hypothetical protein
MALRFLGSDPDSPQGDSPSIWDDGDTYVLQGWRVSDPAVVTELLQTAGRDHVPEHETLIRFPKRMMPLFRELSD